MGLVGFLYDKMGTYNIALYGSGRFCMYGDLQHSVVWVWYLYDKMGTYNIALYGSGRFLV